MRHTGFTGLGPVSSGELRESESQTLRVTLGTGVCYVVAAFGAASLTDLAMTVVGPDDAPVAEARTSGRTAIASFCAEREGEHLVTLTAEHGGGDFRFAYWSEGAEGGGEGGEAGNSVAIGRPVTGTLAPGQTYVDYTLRLRERRLVTIDLESGEFDAYLFLLLDGTEIQRDDDGGDGLNSRIAMPLEPGTYTVRVGSFMNRGAGRFTLTVR
jgi:hypothetical protein